MAAYQEKRQNTYTEDQERRRLIREMTKEASGSHE